MSQYWNLRLNLEDNTTNLGNADIEGYGQISVLLSKYVLKEKGKGLSTNDFTNNDKQKLNSVEVGAERNVLETISINNGPVYRADDNKNINLNIATKTSQLENDTGFAVLECASLYSDYRDSYVGKSKTSFNDATNISIGKDSTTSNCGIAIGECSNSNGGVAIGRNTSTSNVYEVNINNRAKYNKNTSLWEMKNTESVLSDCAISNINGTDLTCLDTVISNLADEIQTRCCDDETLQCNINDEIQNRCDADEILQCNINDVCARICTIESYIPNQTSCTNQLADKDFVNSSIQTNTANFRGNWINWLAVPNNKSLYPQDYAGNTTPTVNDYLVIQDASDYTLETLVGTWRFKYTGNWESLGKNGWIPEYQVNEEPFTSEQLYAINSGITSAKVTCYDNHVSNTNNPHNVTKSQIGLGNVDNTADNTKCVKDTVCFNGKTYEEVRAEFSGNVSMVNTNQSENHPIILCTGNDSVGKSLNCALTFNPGEGTLSSDSIYLKRGIDTCCDFFKVNCCCFITKTFFSNNDNLAYQNSLDVCPFNTDICSCIILSHNNNVNVNYSKISLFQDNINSTISLQTCNGDACTEITQHTGSIVFRYNITDCPDCSRYYNICLPQGCTNLSAKNADCFNGCTYACACADIRSGLTDCTGTVTSIKLYCGTTCKCEITSSGSFCLGSNAFNSTTIPTNVSQLTNDSGYTSNTGTVTSINVSVNGCSGTAVTTSGTVTITGVCACVGNLTNATTTKQNILMTANTTAGCKLINTSSTCPFTFTPSTGLVCATAFCGNFCGSITSANYATCLYNRQTGASKVSNVYFYTGCTNSNCTPTNFIACICGTNGYFYGNVCGTVCGTVCGNVIGYASSAGYATCLYNRISGKNCVGNVYFFTNCTNANCATTNYSSCVCGKDGYYYGNICGSVSGTATNACCFNGCTFAQAKTNIRAQMITVTSNQVRISC